eukprot:CAMPEP_0176376074 /NCGR_PEP_ID=MMETSP0126-20121128/27931_1 /TAXON_ID=141414 ORGANISM="Strombidinopsis acuminatum, Strain SPMC142" /NCGR_SAMPLE_ID=MMETSP0126 /ASSEMBLY_ACC=CAM_ASM_000229 /LENGTH=378 /DNA_ID=CAMNT_0017737361 /DNA_START=38 /DNA_END=1174 /DNA_ORIENTATION=+
MKLYTNYKGNILTNFGAVVAKMAKVDFELVLADQKVKDSKDFKAKNLTGKFPFLETPEGCLVESLAIAKHFARLGNADLLGKDAFERAQVDQWAHWAMGHVMPNAYVVMQAVFGWGGPNPVVATADYNDANKALKEQLKVVNTQMKGAFLLGDNVTVADIVLAAVFLTPFQTVLDGGFRKAMAKAGAWFEKVTALPEFVAVFGHVRACAKPMKPVLIPEEKKKAAPKPVAAAKPKEEKKEEKKDINPLDALPPTKFDLFNFKTFFVNNKDKAGEGIDETLKQVDFEGFAFWFIHYDKYGSEGQVLYKTDNLLNGFMQRIDHFKKHAFARHAVTGEEGNYDIEGVWLFRGTTIPQEMIDHPQFEYCTHRKMDCVNNAAD